MRVARFMSAREYGLFMKGKTIRPIYDCSGSSMNTMESASVCFFPWSDDHEAECMKQTRFAREIVGERLEWTPGGGYLCIFEINAKRLQSGEGLYSEKRSTEYYMPCYNKKLVKLIRAEYRRQRSF